jgi:hypothetical protein
VTALIREIQELQGSLNKRKGHLITQLVLFLGTTMIVLFFGSIIVYDLVVTFQIYFMKLYKNNKKKHNPFDDDNEFVEFQYNENEYEMDTIEKSVMAQSAIHRDKMKDIVEWKSQINNTIAGGESGNATTNLSKIENQVTLDVIEGSNDDYEYDSTRNGDSFWKMLIMPPQYNEYITSKAKPYHKLDIDI